jgi:hypothetical protein
MSWHPSNTSLGGKKGKSAQQTKIDGTTKNDQIQ